jgi:hypothetical protein
LCTEHRGDCLQSEYLGKDRANDFHEPIREWDQKSYTWPCQFTQRNIFFMPEHKTEELILLMFNLRSILLYL